jgi:hypothetical protein
MLCVTQIGGFLQRQMCQFVVFLSSNAVNVVIDLQL